jgi:hypothetical protein
VAAVPAAACDTALPFLSWWCGACFERHVQQHDWQTVTCQYIRWARDHTVLVYYHTSWYETVQRDWIGNVAKHVACVIDRVLLYFGGRRGTLAAFTKPC